MCYVAGGEIVEIGRTFYEEDAPPAATPAPDADLLGWLWGPAELAEARMEHDTGHSDAAYWPGYDPAEETARWQAYVTAHPEVFMDLETEFAEMMR